MSPSPLFLCIDSYQRQAVVALIQSEVRCGWANARPQHGNNVISLSSFDAISFMTQGAELFKRIYFGLADNLALELGQCTRMGDIFIMPTLMLILLFEPPKVPIIPGMIEPMVPLARQNVR
jgi:hypothetical protein